MNTLESPTCTTIRNASRGAAVFRFSSRGTSGERGFLCSASYGFLSRSRGSEERYMALRRRTDTGRRQPWAVVSRLIILAGLIALPVAGRCAYVDKEDHVPATTEPVPTPGTASVLKL